MNIEKAAEAINTLRIAHEDFEHDEAEIEAFKAKVIEIIGGVKVKKKFDGSQVVPVVELDPGTPTKMKHPREWGIETDDPIGMMKYIPQLNGTGTAEQLPVQPIRKRVEKNDGLIDESEEHLGSIND